MVTVGETVGELRDLGGIHREVFTGGAGGLETHDLQLFAEIIFAVEAGIAASAEDLRLDGHPFAGLDVGNIFAYSLYLGGDLMALGHGIGGIGMGTVENVDVTAADTDLFNLDQHLIGTRFGDRDFINRLFYYKINCFITSRSLR